MMDIAPYVADVEKYTSKANESVVEALVASLAPVLGNRDAMLVSCSDDSELDTVRTNFVANKLGITDEAKVKDALITVCEKMKDDRTKGRVTFYYLIAEELGALGKIA